MSKKYIFRGKEAQEKFVQFLESLQNEEQLNEFSSGTMSQTKASLMGGRKEDDDVVRKSKGGAKTKQMQELQNVLRNKPTTKSEAKKQLDYLQNVVEKWGSILNANEKLSDLVERRINAIRRALS